MYVLGQAAGVDNKYGIHDASTLANKGGTPAGKPARTVINIG